MDKINDELKKLELEIADVKRRLQALPDGSLVCSRNGNYWKMVLELRRRAFLSSQKRPSYGRKTGCQKISFPSVKIPPGQTCLS